MRGLGLLVGSTLTKTMLSFKPNVVVYMRFVAQTAAKRFNLFATALYHVRTVGCAVGEREISGNKKEYS